MLLFNTFSMHTRLRSTVVCPREAQRAMGAGWAQAVEPVDLIHARSSAHTWVWVTLIDLHIAFNSYNRAIQRELVVSKVCIWLVLWPKYFVNITLLHFWNIYLLLTHWFYCILVKHTCVSWGAHAFVLVNAVVAFSVLTGVAGTVIFIDLTV